MTRRNRLSGELVYEPGEIVIAELPDTTGLSLVRVAGICKHKRGYYVQPWGEVRSMEGEQCLFWKPSKSIMGGAIFVKVPYSKRSATHLRVIAENLERANEEYAMRLKRARVQLNTRTSILLGSG